MNSCDVKNNCTDYNIELFFVIAFSAEIIEETIRLILPFDSTDVIWVSLIDIAIIVFACFNLLLYKNRFIRISTSRTVLQTGLFFVSWVILWIISSVLLGDLISKYEFAFVKFIIKSSILFYCGINNINVERMLYYFARLLPIPLIYAVLSMLSGNIETIYLNLSYNVLPWCIISYSLFFATKKIRYLLIAIVLFLFMFVFGARMPVLCVVFFLFLLYFWRSTLNKKILFGTSIIVVMIIIALILLDITKNNNLRFVSLLFQGKLLYSEERTNIYCFLINNLMDNPMRVLGLFGDRVLIMNNFANTNTLGFTLINDGNSVVYAHNLFLEILVDFGFIFGGILCLIFVVLICKVLKELYLQGNILYRCYISMLFVIGFLPLMVSSSWIINTNLWLLVGYSICLFQKGKRCNAY